MVHGSQTFTTRSSPAKGLMVCIKQREIASIGRNNLRVNGWISEKKEDCNICFIYFLWMALYPRCWANRQVSTTYCISCFENAAPPTGIWHLQLIFKNLLRGKVWSCDSWWVTGASLKTSLMWNLDHTVLLRAFSWARHSFAVAEYSGSHPQIPSLRERSIFVTSCMHSVFKIEHYHTTSPACVANPKTLNAPPAPHAQYQVCFIYISTHLCLSQHEWYFPMLSANIKILLFLGHMLTSLK